MSRDAAVAALGALSEAVDVLAEVSSDDTLETSGGWLAMGLEAMG